MTRAPLPALLELAADADTPPQLLSPAVGRFRAAVAPGALLQSGDLVGNLEVLERATPLVLPHTAAILQVVEVPTGRGAAPVGYRDVLLTLQSAQTHGDQPTFSLRPPSAEGLPDDAFPAESPTDGLFYTAPSPDDPPFVQVGDVIEPGHVIGLVEVMKFFYEIKFEPTGLQGPAEVVRLVADNASPVEAGDVILYWVAK